MDAATRSTEHRVNLAIKASNATETLDELRVAVNAVASAVERLNNALAKLAGRDIRISFLTEVLESPLQVSE